jgi:2-haloacid dehalogenase
MIKNIIFDFGNVLIRWDPRFLYRRYFNTEVELEKFMQNEWKDEWNENLDKGISLAQNMQLMSEKYPQHRTYIEAFHLHWQDALGGVIQESVELLYNLQRAGYATYGLTNWSAETFAIVRTQYPFFGTFRGIVVSGEERVCKPSAEIFRILLQRYQLNATECVLLDDRKENIEGAHYAGLNAILFTSAQEAREALHTLTQGQPQGSITF